MNPAPNTSPVRGALVLAALLSLALWIGAASAPEHPEIVRLQARLQMDGPLLLVHVRVPAGLTSATLESQTFLSSGPWVARATQSVAAEGGEIVFQIPKPAGMEVFRVRGETLAGTVEPATRVSGEARVVTAPPPAVRTAPASNRPPNARRDASEVVLHFKAVIDGSDRIELTRYGAAWEHVDWRWPNLPISVNGVEWKPAEKNLFTSERPNAFLPSAIDFGSAELEIIEARDVVAMEKGRDALQIFISDTPNGAATYEFRVRLPTARPTPGPRPGAEAATLRLTGRIDGSERVIITRRGATWEHRHWEWPQEVSLNEAAWNPREMPFRANESGTRFLPENVDFATARVTSRRGRDIAAVEARADELIIHLADNANGSSEYEVNVTFAGRAGGKPSGQRPSQ